MTTKKTHLYPARRLNDGAAILAAAEFANVRLVQKRLSAFADAQRAYAKAQRAVDAAEAELSANQATLEERDAEQDAAVEALARALVNDGGPRANPFAAFDMPAPSAIRQLHYAEEATAIHRLAASVQRGRTTSPAARRAAQVADEAASRLEKELAPIGRLQISLRSARQTRDHIGKTWDAALAALKRGARAAADDGASELYLKLFPPVRRVKKKTESATPASGPTPSPAPEAQAQHTQ